MYIVIYGSQSVKEGIKLEYSMVILDTARTQLRKIFVKMTRTLFSKYIRRARFKRDLNSLLRWQNVSPFHGMCEINVTLEGETSRR